ncbi:transposase, IS4 family protein [Burkholderia lata]|uniref:Transposase, IS4 family protein n=1 Tax=Burkholderia lata (strain ATCC 17760 / DSM 23089 / LMG 22485 / NCIMB 9086 / R18194 / 383) TaxID=482957 RepID=A0A6P2H8B9_BURL3|nr:transposase, IS4 family protein [Burkholderia lata]
MTISEVTVKRYRTSTIFSVVASIDLAIKDVPDATALSKFRLLPLERDLTRTLLDEIYIALRGRGLPMKGRRWGGASSGSVRSLVDTLVDASDVLPAHALLNRHEQEALGNAGCLRIICRPACVKMIEATAGVAQRVACGRHVLFRDRAAYRRITRCSCLSVCIRRAKCKGPDASSES